MKIIIAGSRDITDYTVLEVAVMETGWVGDKTEIVSGMAKGVDTLAVEFAKYRNLKLHKFPADWKKYGKQAGIIRNIDMANFADALIAVWDGKSKGTKNMIDVARARKLRVFVWRTDIGTALMTE